MVLLVSNTGLAGISDCCCVMTLMHRKRTCRRQELQLVKSCTRVQFEEDHPKTRSLVPARPAVRQFWLHGLLAFDWD